MGAAALVAVAAACGGGDDDTSATTAEATTEAQADGLTLTSTAFAEGETIPVVNTCDGPDLSPQLAWAGVPDGTESFAVQMDDPDAGDFTHWIAWDIDGNATVLREGASGVAADVPAEGLTDFGAPGYGGPCPPPGETHAYDITLTALDAPLDLDPATATPADLTGALAGATVLDSATLSGSYTRG